MDPLAAYAPAPESAPAAPTNPLDLIRIPVTDEDQALLAWGKCKRCWGTGFFQVRKQYMDPVTGRKVPIRREHPEEWLRELCHCAQDRFPKLQATVMDPKTGELFYTPPLLHATPATRALYEAAVRKVANEMAAAKTAKAPEVPGDADGQGTGTDNAAP